MDIYLEASLEPFHNDTLYNDFVTELEVLLTPWVIKIARLLVDDDRFVSTNQTYSWVAKWIVSVSVSVEPSVANTYSMPS